MSCGCLLRTTLVKNAIPSLHVVPPYLRSHLPQQSRRYVQHGGGRLEHETDAVDEMLSFRVNVVQQQSQPLSIQHRAHRCMTPKWERQMKDLSLQRRLNISFILIECEFKTVLHSSAYLKSSWERSVVHLFWPLRAIFLWTLATKSLPTSSSKGSKLASTFGEITSLLRITRFDLQSSPSLWRVQRARHVKLNLQ